MTLRPRPATLAAAAVGLLLGACGGSLYDSAGVPKIDSGNQCDATTHVCPGDPNNACFANTDPNHCGATCEVCGAAPANGVRACVQPPGGGAYGCGFTCTAPARACGAPLDACLPDDVNACGPSCLDCNASKPAGTTATCVAGAAGNECSYTCAPGFFACASGCCAPTAVAAGGDQACAIASDGGLLCWGLNSSGQLGNPGPSGSLPRLVTGLSAVSAVAVGDRHACAVKGPLATPATAGAGVVWCWGADDLGQLGDGAVVSSGPTPVSTGLSDVLELVAGTDHTCALKRDGKVYCWGANVKGQLGTGAAGAPVTAPPAAGILSGVTDIAAGGDSTCALAAGAVRCWGANGSGQTGAGNTTTPQATPVTVALPNGASASIIGVGGGHACAGLVGGSPSSTDGLYCWGANDFGQVGTGSTSGPVLAPVNAVKLDNGTVTFAISGGTSFTCGAKDNTELICNGKNDQSQAAAAPSATVLDRAAAVNLGGGRLVHATSGRDHSCVLVDTGVSGKVVRCWGRNLEGQLGRDAPTTSADTLVVPP